MYSVRLNDSRDRMHTLSVARNTSHTSFRFSAPVSTSSAPPNDRYRDSNVQFSHTKKDQCQRDASASAAMFSIDGDMNASREKLT